VGRGGGRSAIATLDANAGLLLKYTFDSGTLTGTTFKNLATNANDLSILNLSKVASNGVTISTLNNIVGTGAAQFNGTTYLNATTFYAHSAFTISFWLYAQSKSDYQCISANSASVANNGWIVYLNATGGYGGGGYLELWMGNNNNTGFTVTRVIPITTILNQWYFFSFVFNSGYLYCYVNGALQTTTTYMYTNFSTPVSSSPISNWYINPATTTGTLGIGANGNAGYPVASGTIIDSFRYFNTALSLTDIGTLYGEKNLFPAGRLFHLDASTASNFTFSSGNNISAWNDLMGNYNFTSIGGNGTNHPYVTYDSTNKRIFISGVNGYPGYQLNSNAAGVASGSCAFLQNILSSSIPLTNGGTFYCVIQIDSNNTWANGPFTFSSDIATSNLYAHTNGNLMYINTLGSNRAGPITITPPNGGQNFYTKAIYKVTVTTGNVFTYQYITSTNNVSQTYGGGTRGIANAMFLGAGGRYVSGIYTYNTMIGYIYEVMLFDTLLSSANQTSVETYLINKWSL